MVIGGLILLVVVLGWFTFSGAGEIKDYRAALDEANSVIDQSHTEIEDAQSQAQDANFDALHGLIDGLNIPETISDPHPPSAE